MSKTKTEANANILTLTIDMSTVTTAESPKYPGHLFLNPVGNPYGKVKAIGSDGRQYNLKVSLPPLAEDKARAAASADVKAAEGNSLAAQVADLTKAVAALIAMQQPKTAKAK